MGRGTEVPRLFLLRGEEEFSWTRRIEVAEIGRVDDVYVRPQGALGAVEIEVAVGCRWRCRKVCDEIMTEASINSSKTCAKI